MKRFLLALALLLLAGTAHAEIRVQHGYSYPSVRVQGYYRSSGTYVQPHYRSYPDASIYNNYGYNPYTGQLGQSGYYAPSYQYVQPAPYVPQYQPYHSYWAPGYGR